MSEEQKSAVITLVAMIDKLKASHLDAALDKIDLATDAFEDELQTVKDMIGWEDEEEEDDE